MATNRRVERVAAAIKREVSQMLVFGIKDDRVGAGMVSVTDVELSGDLQHAKIFVSIYGTEAARAETMAGLKAVTGQIRSEIGQRIRLRRTPEVVFKEDRSFERGSKVLSLINELAHNRPNVEEDDALDSPDQDNLAMLSADDRSDLDDLEDLP
jgi:ribosome-binding factor A